jgi:hypothetical protein
LIKNTVIINTDEKGNFTGVHMLGDDKTYTVEDWNKKFTSLDADNGDKK